MDLRLPLRWRLPVVAREMVRAANRKRTYSLRTALLLLLVLLLLLQGVRLSAASLMSGAVGVEILVELNLLLTLAFCAMIPIQSAAAITTEKERGTLVLLLLTSMGPGRLLLQHWLAQVLQALLFVLTVLPLFALAYTCGGVQGQGLWAMPIGLIEIAMQFAAIGLCVSCWCRTTRTAVILTIGVLVAWYALGCQLLALLTLTPGGAARTLSYNPFALLLQPIQGSLMGGRSLSQAPLAVLLPVLPSAAFLGLGWLSLRRWREPTRDAHAAAEPAPEPARAPSAHDPEEATPAPARRGLPSSQPVRWRFFRLSALRHRFAQVLVALFLLGLLTLDLKADQPMIVVLLLLGAEVLLLISAFTGFLPRERVGQTLPVLLTTPVGALGIRRGLEQAAVSLLVPMLGVALVLLLVAPGNSIEGIRATWTSDQSPWLIQGAQALAIANLLVLVAALSLWCGARFATPAGAFSAALLLLIALLLAGPMLLACLASLEITRDSAVLYLLNPVALLMAPLEERDAADGALAGYALGQTLLVVGLGALLRGATLRALVREDRAAMSG